VRIKSSVECWLFSRDRRVLLLQAPARHGEHEAFWQPVTGGVEEGETVLQAALREVREETGLWLTGAELTEVAADVTVQVSGELSLRKTVYRAEAPSVEVSVNPDEHQAYRWVPADQVADALYWDSNRRTWELVRRTLEPVGR
jgi:dATP pyrophosphohydrolase